MCCFLIGLTIMVSLLGLSFLAGLAIDRLTDRDDREYVAGSPTLFWKRDPYGYCHPGATLYRSDRSGLFRYRVGRVTYLHPEWSAATLSWWPGKTVQLGPFSMYADARDAVVRAVRPPPPQATQTERPR